MIKFLTHPTEDGPAIMGLGISAENVRRLKAGQPIEIDGGKMVPGLALRIVIFYGETEEVMVETLKRLGKVDPDTRIFSSGSTHTQGGKGE